MPVRVIGPKDLRDSSALDVTSQAKTWTRALSPMLLGPVELYRGYCALNVENAWQYSKVYPGFVDQDGNPLDAYWQWAKQGWNKRWADRYPMGKGAVPLYSLWDGERLGYIEARKRIYVPLYGQAVLDTYLWDILYEQYVKRGELTLFDFDGYDYLKLGMTLEDVLNDPTRKMGHAFILAMMLEA